MDCPQFVADQSQCKIIGLTDSQTCRICKSQWTQGVPPTIETPTPCIKWRLKRPAAPRPVKRFDDPLAAFSWFVVAPKKMPIRKPKHCDHSGRILSHGQTCQQSIYACDIHGQATCGPSQPGVTRCQECDDFEAII